MRLESRRKVCSNLVSASESSRTYEHVFLDSEFASGKKPCDVEKLSLCILQHDPEAEGVPGPPWYSACVSLSFTAASGIRPVTWYRAKLADCCNIGPLRRHSQNEQCCWPKSIWVNGTPTPDYVAPQPEWFRGDPDDLNDAPFWPTLDIDLMEDSPEAPVRYSGGELQLRIKDVGSDGYGIPWGHTRIYSNRLSNSFDFGNGHNWLIHEWPQLVRRRTDPNAVKLHHPKAEGEPTGCTLVLLRGTRNALWFDEFEVPPGSADPGPTQWRARFGAKHMLVFDTHRQLFILLAPNGHIWEFHAFTPNCFETSNEALYKNRDARLDGKFVRHIGPGGEEVQSISATYNDLHFLSSSGPYAANCSRR